MTLQTPVKSVDLFNALKRCQHGPASQELEASVSDVIVGDEYVAVKQQVLVSEQVLLREIRFELAVDHPWRYLFNFATCLGCSRDATQLAAFLVNDSLVDTDLCLRHRAPEIAAGCLAVALALLERENGPGPRLNAGYLGVQQDRLQAVGVQVCEMLHSYSTGGSGVKS